MGDRTGPGGLRGAPFCVLMSLKVRVRRRLARINPLIIKYSLLTLPKVPLSTVTSALKMQANCFSKSRPLLAYDTAVDLCS
jgi:hypothetical protein